MVPVGVLLLVLAVAFGVGFLVSPGDSADIQFYGLMLQDLSARNLVILGIITGLIAALGAESIRWGTARWRRRRRIARKKERELDAERASAEAEQEPAGAEETTADTVETAPRGSSARAEAVEPESASGPDGEDETPTDKLAGEEGSRG